MNRHLIFIILFVTMIICNTAIAANHYIRAGATGNNSGAAWNNAYSSFPDNLVRGDTYYVADGDYGHYAFNDNESGSTYIYIKKAIENDHGTSIGWSASYGDGQARFDCINISTSYWEIDGQRGQGAEGSLGYTQHGFKIYTSITDEDRKLVRLNASGVSYITLKHIEMEHCGYSQDLPNDGLYAVRGGSHLTMQYCWIHKVERITCYLLGYTDVLFEYNWFTERYSQDSYGMHGEFFYVHSSGTNANHVYRYNVFRNGEGTAGIALQQTNPQYGFEIYGNVFYNDEDHILDGYNWGTQPTMNDFDYSNGSIADTGTNPNGDVQVYNNTFVDLNGQAGIAVSNPGTYGIIVRNNLWVGCDNVFIIANTQSDDGEHGSFTEMNSLSLHDYTLLVGCNLIESDDLQNNTANVQTHNITLGETSWFADYTNHDYRLTTFLPGYTLSAPFNFDMDGTIRGGDGEWDIGAFEYDNHPLIVHLN